MVSQRKMRNERNSRMRKRAATDGTDGTDREFLSASSVKSVAPACFASLQHSNTPLDPMNPTDQNALTNLTAEADDDVGSAKKDIKCHNVTKFVPFSLLRRPRGVRAQQVRTLRSVAHSEANNMKNDRDSRRQRGRTGVPPVPIRSRRPDRRDACPAMIAGLIDPNLTPGDTGLRRAAPNRIPARHAGVRPASFFAPFAVFARPGFPPARANRKGISPLQRFNASTL